ncbi:Heterokaryon incompatibility protein Het-C [Ceratocystis lukuohia]|uniref:Heterokaryon incompatibility protein Het-C n=1 Tax=Ceratocystis lukuohia TaxID=2019550 RepID=A0ABR4MSM5_9PEZI
MLTFKPFHLLVAMVVLVFMTGRAAAFGAGNIGATSKIEGQNWRHGDIEDALAVLSMAKALNGKKFSKLQISRVYFGNWLRDYSQAVDVGTVKNVSAEAIRLLLSILGFLTFGYGSGEFEVTSDRLGCYRPEEHIDNPKDYADNLDARQYDRRLRGPVDEEVELAVDSQTGLKNYIANDQIGITTASGHCRNLLNKCIEHGRAYRDGRNKADKYESLRLLGTALHCLEDYFAHSNYIELALIEMGERDVFPHVGRNTKLNIEGVDDEVYPIVTGTFGGVDFLHSVTGEVSDKLAQNELEELEGTLQDSKNKDTSLLRELLDKIPDGVFGGTHKSDELDNIQANATATQMEASSVSPRDPEEFAVYIGQVFQSIMPAIEFHDSILKSISTAIEKIPILPKIIEQLEEQLSIWVFSIIAPTIVPIVQQLRSEMKTGSDEIISSSEAAQHIVFNDDESSNPTHSMLSKDHFSNLLNEPAGRAAFTMVKWVVPQIMDIMDSDEDPSAVIDGCIFGIMAHPAQRNLGDRSAREGRKIIYEVIENWWSGLGDQGQDQYRQCLSRSGVKQGSNHKTGVFDTGHGHGCSGSLHMHKQFGGGAPQTMEDRIAGAAANAILEGATGALSGFVAQNSGVNIQPYKRKEEGSSSGGGFLGGLIGGILNKAGKDDQDSRQSDNYESSYGTQSQANYGSSHNQSSYNSYQNQSRHDGGDDNNSYSQRYDNQESSYSRRNDDEDGNSYGRNNHNSNSGSGRYGGGAASDYYGGGESESRRENSGSGRYGGGAASDYYGGGESESRRENSGYSSRGNESQEFSHNRSNEYQENSYSSHHGRRKNDSDDDDNRGDSYSRRKNDSDDDEDKRGKYGRRRSKGSDNDSNSGRYGGGGAAAGYYGSRDSHEDRSHRRRSNDSGDDGDRRRRHSKGSGSRRGSRGGSPSPGGYGGGHGGGYGRGDYGGGYGGDYGAGSDEYGGSHRRHHEEERRW